MQDYNSTDQLLHQLSQIIAKVNRTYLPPLPDCSHTNLYFDEIGRRITGRWFPGIDSQYLLVFDLFSWEFQILDETLGLVYQISLTGKTVNQAELEIRVVLQELGFPVKKILKPLNFEIPNYPFLTEIINKPNELEMENWIQIRAQANQACFQLLGHVQKQAEVRIWPHHFDTGIYLEFNAQVAIGFGLAMADSMIDRPYYYLSGYALGSKSWNWSEVIALKKGKWIVTDGWKGAVLPIEETPLDKNTLFEWIQNSLKWYLSE